MKNSNFEVRNKLFPPKIVGQRPEEPSPGYERPGPRDPYFDQGAQTMDTYIFFEGILFLYFLQSFQWFLLFFLV